MDLLEVKSRIAEALVESIFRRAQYSLAPVKHPMMLDGTVRVGEFAPHVVVRKERDDQLLEFPISVKYRLHIEQYLSLEQQRGPKSGFYMAWHQWPDLRFVFVSDRPDAERSCFQIVQPGKTNSLLATDLADVPELEIFRQNIEDHEELARRIFSLLAGA